MSIIQLSEPARIRWHHMIQMADLTTSAMRTSTRISLYRSHSGAATAEKSIPRTIGQEFGTLASPASSRDLIGRMSGPNSQS
ncbi:hypothetical protein T265_02079 [Opisthorchis viverrini]|uniref:Uncharacterized protein n=1 Tax=Opisthorchis viverrini TaxID=6198 RepID=A0A074ZWA0_OPIVI|nr:hypothetical protein T265_02079 [Opisthorchis viverrini]KER31708.1 hypothetical protein T265_02079 [Opisthorchis viverrini]